MSGRSLRRREIPISRRRSRPPRHPSPPSPRRRFGAPAARRSSAKPAKSATAALNRCYSEPALRSAGDSVSGADQPDPDGVFVRQLTCTDILPCPIQQRLYEKDAKVVVNVTVGGSPGPIRAMVKLGSRVDETIRLVVHKYSEEGRSPKLDRNAATLFELHSSYFSLNGLNKSDVIGDVGSRSFHLRQISQRELLEMDYDPSSSPSITRVNSMRIVSSPIPQPFFVWFPAFGIGKIMRRMRKLWELLCCMQ